MTSGTLFETLPSSFLVSRRLLFRFLGRLFCGRLGLSSLVVTATLPTASTTSSGSASAGLPVSTFNKRPNKLGFLTSLEITGPTAGLSTALTGAGAAGDTPVTAACSNVGFSFKASGISCSGFSIK